MEQLYVIQIDRCKQYPQYAEQYLQSGHQFDIHSGGRGNGAQGGLYTKKQVNRILGRYPEGIAKAVPVAIGYTDKEAEENASEAHILNHARNWGVDNWSGWMEWDREACCEENDDE